MMGRQDAQHPLYCVVDLEERVPPGHPLRRVAAAVDFTFVRAEVATFYGYNGQVSVDPVVILKLLFLLFLDDVPGERELMRQVAYRLDYLWFLGLGLDDAVPDHSVLSKARSRWGGAVFERLFVRTVRQCVEAGLVDGSKVHVDASVVDADASKNSVAKGPPQMVAALKAVYAEQEAKLDQVREERRRRSRRPRGGSDTEDAGAQPAADAPNPYRIGPERLDPAAAPPRPPAAAEPPDAEGTDADADADASAEADGNAAAAKVNDALVSTTDPDAAVARHAPNCKSGPRPRYMSHRAVDDRAGVITAVASTPGDANEGGLLIGLLEQHEHNSQLPVETAVADSKYGTVGNYLACDALGIAPHMADLNAKQAAGRRRAGIFPDTDFAYDPATDTYRCPAGQTLAPARHHAKRQATDYTTARGVCDACPLRAQCTRAKAGGRRSIKRHDQQRAIDRARRQAASPAARRDRRRRQHLMERSFADASDNHGLKRSRWRGLWRQRVQDLMIAAVQNVRILARNGKGPKPASPAAANPPASGPFASPRAYRRRPRRRPSTGVVRRARSIGCPPKPVAARTADSGRFLGNRNRFGQHAVKS
jgi:transposase